jgi:hypothetical protein
VPIIVLAAACDAAAWAAEAEQTKHDTLSLYSTTLTLLHGDAERVVVLHLQERALVERLAQTVEQLAQVNVVLVEVLLRLARDEAAGGAGQASDGGVPPAAASSRTAHKVPRGRRAFPCRHDLFDHLTMRRDPKDRKREEESLERTHYDDGVWTVVTSHTVVRRKTHHEHDEHRPSAYRLT